MQVYHQPGISPKLWGRREAEQPTRDAAPAETRPRRWGETFPCRDYTTVTTVTVPALELLQHSPRYARKVKKVSKQKYRETTKRNKSSRSKFKHRAIPTPTFRSTILWTLLLHFRRPTVSAREGDGDSAKRDSFRCSCVPLARQL